MHSCPAPGSHTYARGLGCRWRRLCSPWASPQSGTRCVSPDFGTCWAARQVQSEPRVCLTLLLIKIQCRHVMNIHIQENIHIFHNNLIIHSVQYKIPHISTKKRKHIKRIHQAHKKNINQLLFHGMQIIQYWNSKT